MEIYDDYAARSAPLDTTSPTLSSPNAGTPTSDGSTGASVSTNEGNGTLYWAVVTDGGSCTDAQLKAGSGGNIVSGKSGNQAVSGTGTQTIPNITGLTSATAYDIKFLQRDVAGNDSSQASADLTTGGSPIIEQILGFSGAGAAATFPTPAANACTSGPIAADWTTGPATVVQVLKGYAKITEWDGPADYKLLIFSSAGVLLGVSDPLTISTPQYDAFQEFNFTSGPSVTKGSNYIYGWIASTGAQKPYVGGTGAGHNYGTAGTYASPSNYSNVDTLQVGVNVCCYFTGDTQ